MSYLRSLLGDDEVIVFETRQHWFIPLMHVLTEAVLIGLLMSAATVLVRLRPFPQLPNDMVLFGALALGIIVFFSALADIMRWQNEQFVITDRRVLQLQGVINKSVLDSSLEKINDVELHQSWIGRIFNFGNVEILTANDDGVNHMRAIQAPVAFKRAMQDARARYSGYLDRAPVQAYESSRDVRALLEELAALRDRGILSPAEFEAKKRELLARI